MPSSPDDLVGRTLGHFRVVARLGEGGMGVVYKAFDERLHRTVALKVLPDEAMRSEPRRRRFLREARSAAAVSHPNVAAIHDVAEADGHVFLAMEYVAGTTLREEIAGGRLQLPECLRIARSVARALSKAHEKGVVHRDLKPDNVMLGEDREVKVLDFGLAKLLEDEATSRSLLEVDETASHITAEKQIVGTPSYMSPEQATGKKVDARADLFSFGILLYELVTGERPFGGETPVEILIAITRDEPISASSRNTKVPPALERIIDRCLLKRPEDRFASARDLLMALEALEASKPSVSGGVPVVSSGAAGQALTSLDANITKESLRPAPSTRRGWTRLWPVVAGVAALAALAGALALRGAPQQALRPAPLVQDASRHAPVPEAAALAADAEKQQREGRRDTACDEFARAAELDPSFAEAGLSAALCHLESPNDGRPFFRRAWAARASLDERDGALLFAIEPVFMREHEDDAEEGRRLAEAVKRFPDDARLHVVIAGSLRRVADGFEQIIVELDRSLSLDRQQPYALELKADYLAYEGDFAKALLAIDQCLQIAPGAIGCLLERTWVQGAQGSCDLVESDARRMLAIDPASQEGAQILANALYAEGRPLETVREALRRKWEHVPAAPRDAAEERANRINLAILTGDLAAAATLATEEWKEASSSAEAADHGRAARRLGEIDREMGRDKDAADVAKEYLDGRDAWDPSARLDDWALSAEPTPLMLSLELHAGRLSADAAAAEQRATLERWERRIEAPTRPFIWVDAFALPAETPAEAQAAVAARDRFLPVPPYAPLSLQDGEVGRVYLLAGRIAEAVPVLERAGRSCFPLDFALQHTRATAFLGRAREAEGDAAGACRAYDVVHGRWGSAKPLSVTARDAAQRAAALHCPR